MLPYYGQIKSFFGFQRMANVSALFFCFFELLQSLNPVICLCSFSFSTQTQLFVSTLIALYQLDQNIATGVSYLYNCFQFLVFFRSRLSFSRLRRLFSCVIFWFDALIFSREKEKKTRFIMGTRNCKQ